MTITRALVERAIVVWLLLRLVVLALGMAGCVMGNPAAMAASARDSLFFSFAAVPFVLVCATLLSEVDVLRRHERVLLGNLGLSLAARLSIALGIALVGEILFGITSALLLS